MADVLQTSISGLLAFQRAMATTSHNISNVNTEGYSRQRVDFTTRVPFAAEGGWVGTGVKTSGVVRILDETRNAAVRNSQSEHGRLDAYTSMGARIDNLVADKDAGIAPAMQGLFDAMQALTTDPTSLSSREIVIAEAENLAGRFSFFEDRFGEVAQEINRTLEVQIHEINLYAGEIARLNHEIMEVSGRPGGLPNDLLDKRDHALSELSKRIGVTSIIESNGSMNVSIGSGQALVVATTANRISAVSPQTHNPDDPTRVEIGIHKGAGEAINITRHMTGGSISGLLDFRKEVLDPTWGQLKELAVAVHDAFNEQHAQGFDLTGAAGEDFFTFEAGRLRMAIDDPRKLAAAGGDGEGAVGDNENMLRMAQLADKRDPDVLGGASFQEYYATIVGRVGTQTMRANIHLDAQKVLLNQAIAAREEVSGVNLEEEAANLMRFQQAYHASAQVISMSEGMFQALLDAVRR